MTWITPRGWKRKAILHHIDDGEPAAMAGGPRRRIPLLSGPHRGMHVMTAPRAA
jgi:hypothetical protein